MGLFKILIKWKDYPILYIETCNLYILEKQIHKLIKQIFFKGYLKQGETLGLELFIKKFDYNSFDPNSDYSRVSFMTHDNKQRENY